ncbi:hypothetical protein D3C72_2108540 [compost metagenome]
MFELARDAHSGHFDLIGQTQPCGDALALQFHGRVQQADEAGGRADRLAYRGALGQCQHHRTERRATLYRTEANAEIRALQVVGASFHQADQRRARNRYFTLIKPLQRQLEAFFVSRHVATQFVYQVCEAL